jgi:hypothetical protein
MGLGPGPPPRVLAGGSMTPPVGHGPTALSLDISMRPSAGSASDFASCPLDSGVFSAKFIPPLTGATRSSESRRVSTLGGVSCHSSRRLRPGRDGTGKGLAPIDAFTGTLPGSLQSLYEASGKRIRNDHRAGNWSQACEHSGFDKKVTMWAITNPAPEPDGSRADDGSAGCGLVRFTCPERVAEDLLWREGQ